MKQIVDGLDRSPEEVRLVVEDLCPLVERLGCEGGVEERGEFGGILKSRGRRGKTRIAQPFRMPDGAVAKFDV